MGVSPPFQFIALCSVKEQIWNLSTGFIFKQFVY